MEDQFGIYYFKNFITSSSSIVKPTKYFSDDHWDDKDAQVVCRMLGLNPHGAKATSSSHFGRVQVNFAMDDLKCSGTERSLNDCPHNPRHNCGAHEGAGVRCHDIGKV